jgi:hypothetical protein
MKEQAEGDFGSVGLLKNGLRGDYLGVGLYQVS